MKLKMTLYSFHPKFKISIPRCAEVACCRSSEVNSELNRGLNPEWTLKGESQLFKGDQLLIQIVPSTEALRQVNFSAELWSESHWESTTNWLVLHCISCNAQFRIALRCQSFAMQFWNILLLCHRNTIIYSALNFALRTRNPPEVQF